MEAMNFHRLSPFEILKAATLVLLAALLFSVGSASHPTTPAAYLSFSAIMLLQLFEMFAPVRSDKSKGLISSAPFIRGSILTQLVLATLLVAVTDGSGSVYELVYLLPIITAATKLPGREVVVVVAGAIIAMIGFIVTGEPLVPSITHVKEFEDAVAAIVYFSIAGLLIYFFARGEREQRERYRALADQLMETNDELRKTQEKLVERLIQTGKMEERLRQVQQMAVLGEIAGQVAHEVRNPLGIITGSVQMLATRVTDPSTQRHIAVLQEETERLNKAVEGVFRLATPLRIQRERVLLANLLEVVAHVSSAWPFSDGIGVRYEPSKADVAVTGDHDLLHRAIANLVRNACQATPSGGVVIIRESMSDNDANVCVAVIDYGVGMTDDDLNRLGDPFFSKRTGGVGLGFSLANRVIAEHGGTIRVTSILGQGTTVSVLLPVAGKDRDKPYAGAIEQWSG